MAAKQRLLYSRLFFMLENQNWEETLNWRIKNWYDTLYNSEILCATTISSICLRMITFTYTMLGCIFISFSFNLLYHLTTLAMNTKCKIFQHSDIPSNNCRLVITNAHDGSWTHSLTLLLALTSRGSVIIARAYWQDF